jgi:ubiquinone/menaquinone biosynthesis C-methylase UbiE
MEIAGEYPKSTIVGVDMTGVFPRDIKPTNCQFYQCDVLQGLPFPEATFDYVFMR